MNDNIAETIDSLLTEEDWDLFVLGIVASGGGKGVPENEIQAICSEVENSLQLAAAAVMLVKGVAAGILAVRWDEENQESVYSPRTGGYGNPN